MHVGLNLVYLVPGETGGMEVYARELIPALVAEGDGDISFTAFVCREAAAADGPWHDIPSVTVPVRSANRAGWVWGEQALLAGLAAARGVDLVHSLASTAPGWGRFRRVTTIHDLHYRTVPEAHFGLRVAGMRLLVPLSARRSHRVIADSQATRDDVVQHLGVPAARVDVVHLGLGRRPEAEPKPFDTGDRRLLLTAAAKRPHKNLAALLDALAMVPRADRPLLVLPGYATPFDAHLARAAAAAGVADGVGMLDWLADPDLEGLCRSAAVSAFPSLAEGFSLPVLQAMPRGLPVACARAWALPEVAGAAASYLDLCDVGDIARALDAVLADRMEAARLSEAGRRRARTVTWERTARGTLGSYDRAMRDARR
jgi:glycosyltransferase involved in cell wall biosynthesis